MFNVSVNDKKNIYRSKPVMNVDTTGSSASIPKPLTYDYMPEGYPSKGIEYVTLMEEQEVAFYETDSAMEADSPVALAIKQGDKLTVVWDGVSYDVVVKERVVGGPGNLVNKMFGNLALINKGESEDYPFAYLGVSDPVNGFYWITADTAASHTIKVMRQQVKYTPIDANYMPKNLNVVFTGIKYSYEQQIPTSCNVTYDELRRLAESDMPIFAIYKFDVSGVPMCKIITQYKINAANSEGNTEMVFYYQQDNGTQAFAYSSAGIHLQLEK